MREIDIPCMPVNTLEDLLNDPQLCASGLFETYDHPTEGELLGLARPVKYSKIGREPGYAPCLGADTHDILAESEYAEHEIDALLAEGAIADGL